MLGWAIISSWISSHEYEINIFSYECLCPTGETEKCKTDYFDAFFVNICVLVCTNSCWFYLGILTRYYDYNFEFIIYRFDENIRRPKRHIRKLFYSSIFHYLISIKILWINKAKKIVCSEIDWILQTISNFQSINLKKKLNKVC